jgi:cyclic-di-GMP phosphodiesterase TipF (flagellum assembly factor)
VATKIESEGIVVDLLDCDVKLGQGHLFSAPRPVRPDLAHGSPQRGDAAPPRSSTAARSEEGAASLLPRGSPEDARGSAVRRAVRPALGRGAG